MDTITERIEQLTRRIRELANQQASINQQLLGMLAELDALKKTVPPPAAQQAEKASETIVPAATAASLQQPPAEQVPAAVQQSPVAQTPVTARQPLPAATAAMQSSPAYRAKQSSSLEEFIGKNLASKIGILILIVGIFIGAKYAIEHNLVSPVVRIINGYISGLVLAGIALRLKKKYPGYSAVLMGGGLSVLYFITYTAYAFYSLLPQLAAFALMLVITAGIIYAALLYNRVIIAHLAQVGAYAIPFLLSDNSGRYSVLFVYIAIINAGILVLSFRKYWKSLFYVAYAVTWLIFGVWFMAEYRYEQHLRLAWTFALLYFGIFYTAFLAYKLVKKEQYSISDVILLLTNAFVFYGIGYGLLKDGPDPDRWTGLFTAGNALLHFGVSMLLRRLRLADKALQLLVSGLALVFLTLAIPVQFDGNWVTLLWTAEGALLLTVGRRWQRPAYERFGAILVLLSFGSLLLDWKDHLQAFTDTARKDHLLPFLNTGFVSGLLVLAAYGYMVWVNRTRRRQPEDRQGSDIFLLFYDYALPVLFLVTGYFVFQLELQGYFRQLAQQLHGSDGSFGPWGSEVSTFSYIVLLLYAMVFTALVLAVNRQWVKNSALARAGLIGIALMMVLVLLQGLPVLNKMAAYYFEKDGAGLYFGRMNFLVRYLVLAVVALLIWLGCRVVKDHLAEDILRKCWWLVVYLVSLGFASFEYIHWMRVTGVDDQYRFGLSIIWGLFALGLIVYGIWKKLRYIRLAAMVLFMITLIKLFFYDLAGSGTITKTVSFISLGVILLLVSYLYNRYKELLFGADGEGEEK